MHVKALLDAGADVNRGRTSEGRDGADLCSTWCSTISGFKRLQDSS